MIATSSIPLLQACPGASLFLVYSGRERREAARNGLECPRAQRSIGCGPGVGLGSLAWHGGLWSQHRSSASQHPSCSDPRGTAAKARSSSSVIAVAPRRARCLLTVLGSCGVPVPSLYRGNGNGRGSPIRVGEKRTRGSAGPSAPDSLLFNDCNRMNLHSPLRRPVRLATHKARSHRGPPARTAIRARLTRASRAAKIEATVRRSVALRPRK